MRLIAYTSIGGVLLLSACSGNEAATIRPERRDITEAVYATATVQPADYYRVYAEVAGLVEARHVDAGDTVAAGARLFTIRNRSQDAQEENARLALELARAELAGGGNQLQELERQIELARAQYRQDSLDYDRQRRLWEQGIGAQRQVDQYRLAAQASRTRLQTARDQYAQAQRRLRTETERARNNLRITSNAGDQLIVSSRLPGRIYEVSAEAGEVVGPQQSLALIGSRDSFIVEMEVDEADISRVEPGQVVYLTLDSYSGETFEARISKIYPAMDPRSQSFRVEGRFVRRPPTLYPNLTAEANIVLRSRPDALVIPRAYLLGGDSVLLTTGERRAVRTGLQDLRFVEILEGLREDEQLLLPQ